MHHMECSVCAGAYTCAHDASMELCKRPNWTFYPFHLRMKTLNQGGPKGPTHVRYLDEAIGSA